MQLLHDVGRGELAALIGVEDTGIGAIPKALQAELRVKAV